MQRDILTRLTILKYLIFKDGKLEMNSCLLAAISNNFRSAYQVLSLSLIKRNKIMYILASDLF